jgi:hypothetical protein
MHSQKCGKDTNTKFRENPSDIFLSTTNNMQRYTIFFVVVSALHASSGFSAHRQELKTVHAASDTCQTCLLLPLTGGESELVCVTTWSRKPVPTHPRYRNI